MTADKKALDALYPVAEKQAARLRTRTGKALDALTLEAVRDGCLEANDLAISPEALRLQAEVAEAAGRPQLGENLRRGAELAGVAQDTIFETYELLRPGRARDKAELLALAERYRQEFDAPESAALIEEAAEVYERRNLYQKRF